MHLLIFGLGYSASRFVALFGERFEAIVATRRSFAGVRHVLGRPVVFDGTVAERVRS